MAERGIRGATWEHVFGLPFSTSLIKGLEIAYSQDGKTILKKRLADCRIVDGKIRLEIPSKETFLFEGNKIAKVQIRILDPIDNEPNSRAEDFLVLDSLFTEPMKKE